MDTTILCTANSTLIFHINCILTILDAQHKKQLSTEVMRFHYGTYELVLLEILNLNIYIYRDPREFRCELLLALSRDFLSIVVLPIYSPKHIKSCTRFYINHTSYSFFKKFINLCRGHRIELLHEVNYHRHHVYLNTQKDTNDSTSS